MTLCALDQGAALLWRQKVEDEAAGLLVDDVALGPVDHLRNAVSRYEVLLVVVADVRDLARDGGGGKGRVRVFVLLRGLPSLGAEDSGDERGTLRLGLGLRLGLRLGLVGGGGGVEGGLGRGLGRGLEGRRNQRSGGRDGEGLLRPEGG